LSANIENEVKREITRISTTIFGARIMTVEWHSSHKADIKISELIGVEKIKN